MGRGSGGGGSGGGRGKGTGRNKTATGFYRRSAREAAIGAVAETLLSFAVFFLDNVSV